MKVFDELKRLYTDPDGRVRRYVLFQMEELPADFEIEDLLVFLRHAATDEDVAVRRQAQRCLRRVEPAAEAWRCDLRQATTSAKSGTWTQYNIDRREIMNLQRLGKAQTMDMASLDPEDMRRSALHLLGPCVERCAVLAREGGEGEREAAIEALGTLGTRLSVETLAPLARAGAERLAAAASLGELATGSALQALLEAIDGADGEILPDLLVELRAFGGNGEAWDCLAKHAAHGDAKVRRACAQALDRHAEAGAEEILLRFLEDEDDGVVLYACDGLAMAGGPDSVAPLARLVEARSDPWLQRSALRSLGHVGDASATEACRKALASPQATVRAQAIESLVRLRASDQELFEAVFPLSKDPHPLVLGNAVLALTPIDTNLALQKMYQLLQAREPYCRAQGAYCLGYVQHPTALSLLKQTLHQDGVELVTSQAVKALAKFPAADGVDLLLSVLNHHHPSVRIAALRILGSPGFKKLGRVFTRLQEELGREDLPEPVKVAVVESMGRIADPSQYLVVARALEDPRPRVSAAALGALDLLGSLEGISLVEPYVEDPDGAIKSRAALCLWNQGEMRVVDHLLSDLSSSEAEDRLAALAALRTLGASLRRPLDGQRYPLLASELSEHLAEVVVEGDARYTQSLRALASSEVAESKIFDYQPLSSEELGDSLEVDPESLEALAQLVPDLDASNELQMDDLFAKGADIPGGAMDFSDELFAEKKAEEKKPPRPTGPIELALEDLLDVYRRQGPAGAFAPTKAFLQQHDSVWARMLLARAYQEQGQAEAARGEWSLCAERSTRLLPALLGRAKVEQALGEKDKTFASFLEAAEQGLRLMASEIRHARALLEEGKIQKVAKFARQLNQQMPYLEELHGRMGALMLDAHDEAEAYFHLLAAHFAAPRDANVALALAEAARRNGKLDYARRLAQSVKNDPNLDEAARSLAAKLAAIPVN